MPTYQYQCESCQHAFEVLQTMTEPKLRKCPACAKLRLSRLIGSGAGIIFKGTGFYETDYKKKEPAKAEPQSGTKTEAKKGITPKACGSGCGCGK